MSDQTNLRKQNEQFVDWERGISIAVPDVALLASLIEQIPSDSEIRVLDVGGGTGQLGAVLTDRFANVHVDVVDPSQEAARQFVTKPRVMLHNLGFDQIELSRRYDLIVFRTVLHHFIGGDLAQTHHAQQAGLQLAAKLLKPEGKIIVTENFYESFGIFHDMTGKLIYQLTRSRYVAGVMRRLGANTAGIGVRFRSYRSWLSMFESCSLEVAHEKTNDSWGSTTPLAWKVFLLCKQRCQKALVLSQSLCARGS